jgi:hypothetical protein
MKVAICFITFCVLLTACKPNAKNIISKSIAAHGGNKIDSCKISFTFRTAEMELNLLKGNYSYKRVTKDSNNNTIKEILTNTNYTKTKNDIEIKDVETEIEKYKEQINSIAYFVLLPFKLNDKAVNASYMGNVTIADNEYNKVKVWFAKEGGGKDFEDVFCYWFNKKTNTLDYLAYANGGPRFRKAINRQTINGIVMQDYENYELTDSTFATINYDEAFKQNKVKLLSIIAQQNVTIK